MKRRIALSLALALSVISLALVSFDSAATAQKRQRCTADTGFVTLGAGEILRISAVNAEAQDGSGTDNANFIVRKMEYGQGPCSGGVCRFAVESQTTTDPIRLAPGEAASVLITTMTPGAGVRAVIVSNRRNVRVTAAIINTVTGEPTSTSLLDTMEEGECGL